MVSRGKLAKLLDFESWCFGTTKCTGPGEVKELFNSFKKKKKCLSGKFLIRKSLGWL